MFLKYSPISREHAITVARNLYESGECVRLEMGANTSTEVTLNKLFAEFHNTGPRSRRYINNLDSLFAWVTRDDVVISCP